MRWGTRQLTPWKTLGAMLALGTLGAFGCSEGGAPLGPPDQASRANDGGVEPPDIGPGDGGGPHDLGTNDLGGTDGGPSDMGSGPNDMGSGGSCPLIAGTYSVASAGPGCGSLGASQVIGQPSLGSCSLEFTSAAVLSGDTSVSSDGSFVGQSLALGGNTRSCRGTWSGTLGQYSIVCGSGPTVCMLTLN